MILLVCDHPKRELFYLKKLKNNLRKKNIDCKIINKHLILKAYNLYQPRIITVPHTLNYLFYPISKLYKKTKIVLLPTESSIFNKKFIDLFYLNKFSKSLGQSNHHKVDFFFTQSRFTSKYLENKKLPKSKLIDTGFLYLDYWYKKKLKNLSKRNNIGIALTTSLPFRYYKNKNFAVNFYNMDEDFKLNKSPWRFHEIKLNLFYISMIFDIIKKFSKKYHISLRPHPLDKESGWENLFKNNKNVKIDSNNSVDNWLESQDIIISTFSTINIDAYVFQKPHISLVNLIPKDFLNFKAYENFSYLQYKEHYSYKPKNIKELDILLRKIKFKKKDDMDRKLIKYYNFPSKKSSLDNVALNLEKIWKKSEINSGYIKYSYVQKMFKIFFGKYTSSLLLYYLSEIKIYFNKHNNNGYFSFFTRFTMTIPYKIVNFFLRK